MRDWTGEHRQLRAILTLETTRTFFIDTVPQISARQTFDKRLE